VRTVVTDEVVGVVVSIGIAMQDEGRYLVIVESVELICQSSALAREIVDHAKAASGRDEIPPPSEGLREFLEVHVQDAIESRLGPETADRFEENIDLVLRSATHERESLPPPRRGTRGPLVFVVSDVRPRVDAIAGALAHHADVAALSAHEVPPVLAAGLCTMVVVDWANAADCNELLEPLCSAMPRTRVVVWGAPRDAEARLMAAQQSSGGTWINCAGRAAPSHVAGMVLALLVH
jgi:hypothetical protein